MSDDGGALPVWAPESSDILYQSRGRIMAVRYTTRGGTFVADKPRVWAANFGGVVAFDVAPDGNRVAVVVPATPREAPRPDHTIVLLQNVFDELRRRAPAVE
ncbi:MAG TPA: hypothetical protein VES67_24625 [Vicinamibacterales bacterium]|nr:hypothetical protein [Vicinamibacterales bacterium]